MRGKAAPKRVVPPDPKLGNETVSRFIGLIMKQGKKTIAQGIIYGAFDIIKAKTSKDGLEVFEQAMRNVAPIIEVKSRRIGGANYQIPIEVRGTRRLALAMRWIIGASRKRSGKSMADKLAMELIDASQKLGEAMKKREDVHRMAEANRAFAHFA
ncbi:MAG: 30S ribosomal protein S7 [Patescibacteria group bacterium]